MEIDSVLISGGALALAVLAYGYHLAQTVSELKATKGEFSSKIGELNAKIEALNAKYEIKNQMQNIELQMQTLSNIQANQTKKIDYELDHVRKKNDILVGEINKIIINLKEIRNKQDGVTPVEEIPDDGGD
jgi:hypothetical protein